MNFLVCFRVCIWKINITPTHTKVIKNFFKKGKNEKKTHEKIRKEICVFKKEKNQG